MSNSQPERDERTLVTRLMGEPDGDRIWQQITKLKEFSAPGPGTTRRAFGAEHAAAREWWAGELAAAGLSVRIDDAGNLVGRYGDENLPTIATGSHLDTVSEGGDFDGIAGVVCGLEAVRQLMSAGYPVALEVIDFLAEEPSDFGLSCIGSRGLAGTLTPSQLELRDPDGESVAEAIRRVGGNPSRLGEGPVENSYLSFVELHIEQGPRLESQGLSVSAVSAIAGIRRWQISFRGRQGHSGTTLMSSRSDAMVAASRFIVEVNSLAEAMPDPFVATVGRMVVHPNSPNAIAGLADLVLEARASDGRQMTEFANSMEQLVRSLRDSSPTEVDVQTVSDQGPIALDEGITELVREQIESRGIQPVTLVSGAGHDAAHMAQVVPAGMVFVRSEGGQSHNPDEFSTQEDLVAGTEVLMGTLAALADRHEKGRD